MESSILKEEAGLVLGAIVEEIEEGKVARELTERFHILRPLLLVVEEGAYREARTSLHIDLQRQVS